MSIPPAGERLARLSRTAAIRAAALTSWVDPETLGTAALAGVLYRVGGSTPSVHVDERWPHLLLRRAQRHVRHRLVDYARTSTEGWMSWTRTDADVVALVHKVYLSPAVPSLTDALPSAFDIAASLQVPAWKVGADLAGIHRADKFVLYFASAEAADDAATVLAEHLSLVAPQGVPFTAQVGSTGIVSRGIDRNATSWRAVVCRSLADALLAARARNGTATPPRRVVDEAYASLTRDGFDTRGWFPVAAPPPAVPQTADVGAVP